MPCIPSSSSRARDRPAPECREALGERRVTAPPHSHLAVDDDARDAGYVTARDRTESVRRQRGGRSIADDEVRGRADGDGSRPALEPEDPGVVTRSERDRLLRWELAERGELAHALDDAHGHDTSAGRRVARAADAYEHPGLAAALQDIKRRTEAARLPHLQSHRHLADDRVESRLVARPRPAVDVTAAVA